MQVETQWLKPRSPGRRAQQEPALLRWGLIAAAIAVITILIIVPVVNVFAQAFAGGWRAYWRYLTEDSDTQHAILLTLFVAPIAVAGNVLFGVAAAWAITRFRFPGRTILTTMIDLPFAISPVVVGLTFMLLFGRQGYFGPWLMDHGVKIVFAWPGIVLATMFVTVPFVARELIPVMEAIGSDEETAAVSLGASGWQMFWRVTLPTILPGVLSGALLAFTLSLDDFVITFFTTGPGATTLPIYVYGLLRRIITPQVNALSTVWIAIVLLAVLGLQRLQSRQV